MWRGIGSQARLRRTCSESLGAPISLQGHRAEGLTTNIGLATKSLPTPQKRPRSGDNTASNAPTCSTYHQSACIRIDTPIRLYLHIHLLHHSPHFCQMQLTPLPAPPAFDNSEWQDLTEPMSSVLHWQSEVWNQPPPSLPSIRGGTSTSGSSKSLGGDIPSRPHSSATVTAGAAISRPPSTLMRAANKVRSAARLVVPDCIAEGLSMAEVIRQVTNGFGFTF